MLSLYLKERPGLYALRRSSVVGKQLKSWLDILQYALRLDKSSQGLLVALRNSDVRSGIIRGMRGRFVCPCNKNLHQNVESA